MKKYILVICVAVVAVAAGVLSVRHYQNYQTKQKHLEAAAVAAASDQLRIKQEAQDKLTAGINLLKVECNKGRAAYDALPTTLKKKISAPNCEAVSVN